MKKSEKLLQRLFLESELCRDLKIIYMKSTCSTNELAKNAPRGGAPVSIYVAEKQTGGRGRLGRSFSSKKGGLYMTLRFEKSLPATSATRVTVFAAVAIARAIEKLAPVNIGIKWVNDLILDGKKLAGILCEGVAGEDGNIEVTALGIGINVKNRLPKELFDIATSLSEHTEPPSTVELAFAITNEIYDMQGLPFSEVIEEYRSRSVIIGKDVRVIKKGIPEYAARAIGIDGNGALILELPSGKTEILSTGEVSVRAL